MTVPESAPAPRAAGGDAGRSLFAAVLAGQWRVVLAAAAFAVIGSLAFTLQQTKTYAATAAVVVQAPLGQPASAEPNMATEAQVARSFAVASAVQQRLGLAFSPEQVLARLSVRVPVDSTVLKFTYSSAQPVIAQEGAHAFAVSYLDVRRRQFDDQIAASAASISAQIDGLTKQVFALQHRLATTSGASAAILKAQRDTAAQQIGQLKQKLAGVNGSANIVSPGSVLGSVPLPTHPVRPRIVLDALVALVLGGLLGFGIAAALESMAHGARHFGGIEARRDGPVRGFGTAPIATVDRKQQPVSDANRVSANAALGRRAKAKRQTT
jgi:succinoglycan biosynthesis transport protein ExoP